jgi:hypothetical protein
MRFLPLVALIVLATPAAAQDSPQQPSALAPEKKICRAGQSTGTIIPPKRICHTKAEWQQIDGANSNENRRFHDNSTGGGGFGGTRGG